MGSAAVEQDSRAATYLTLVLMKLTLVTLTLVHHGTQALNEFPIINVPKEEFAKKHEKATLVTLTLTLCPQGHMGMLTLSIPTYHNIYDHDQRLLRQSNFYFSV